MSFIFTAVLAADPAQHDSASTPARPAEKTSSSPGAGQQSFESHCASCHGLDGLGEEHAHAIATPQAAGALDDRALFEIIRDGIPSKGMPPFGSLSAPDIHAIITYLRRLTGKNAVQPGKGNPVQGATLAAAQEDEAPDRKSVV